MIIKVLIAGILAYLLWALFHHRRDKSLTFSVLVEYLLTAVLAMILIFGVIY